MAGASAPPSPRSFRRERLRWTWGLLPLFLWIARPTAASLLLGALPALAGLLLRAWAAGSIRKEEALAVGGPYAHLRHPLYVGSFLVGVGLVIAAARWIVVPFFVVGFLWLYIEAVRAETRLLERRFGDAFEEYRSLVPGVRPRLRRYRPGADRASSRTPSEEMHEDGLPVAILDEVGFRLSLFLRNEEWQAAVGVAGGFGLLGLKAWLWG